MSPQLLNLEVLFALFYCVEAFLETERQIVNVVREKGKRKEERWIWSVREGERGEVVCVGDGRER